MTKDPKEQMARALVSIRDYVQKFKPQGEDALKAQLSVIEEIAVEALEWVERYDRGEDMTWG